MGSLGFFVSLEMMRIFEIWMNKNWWHSLNYLDHSFCRSQSDEPHWFTDSQLLAINLTSGTHSSPIYICCICKKLDSFQVRNSLYPIASLVLQFFLCTKYKASPEISLSQIFFWGHLFNPQKKKKNRKFQEIFKE